MALLILNVDDFAPQRYARSAILRGAGFTVIEASTGHQALALAREKRPALVVLDVHLPDIDGMEVCRQIKADRSGAAILVLHVSATFRDVASRTRALNNGADGYLAEPVEPDEFLAHVQALLRIADAEAQARRARTARKRTEVELRTSEERLRLAQQAAHVGVYDWNLTSGEIVWTHELARIYGIAMPPNPSDRQDAWLRVVHEEDRDRLLEDTEAWLHSTECEREWEYRIVRPDGEERWIAGHALALRDADGRPLRVIATNQDITERNLLRERIDAQRAQLEAVYQAMSDGMSVFSMSGELVMVNDGVRRLVGDVTPHRTTNDTLSSAAQTFELREVSGAPVPFERWPVSRALRGESFDDCVLVTRRDHGQEWTISYTGRPIRDARGQQTLALIVSRDVTTEKRIEAALRESEETARRRAEELEKLMDVIPAAIWVADDAECRTITGNRTANQLFEATDRENVSAGLTSGGDQNVTRRFFRHGVELQPDAMPMQQAVSTGQEVRNAELEVLTPSGRTVTTFGGATPLFTADGRVRGAIAAFVDISERKRAEERLREALIAAERREAEIESIYDSAPIGLCIFDPQGRYLRINRRLAEMNGLTPEEHIGRTFHEVVPGIAEQVEPLLSHVVATGTPASAEIQEELPLHPGVVRTVIQNWHPVYDEDGAVVGVNVAVEEITRLKAIEQELRKANRIKDDFLATLSHELRTPLAAILGWAHMLERGGLDEKNARRAVQIILRNAEAQKELIADVLDVSRMLAGKLRLEMQQIDLLQVTHAAVASVRPAFDAKGVQLELASELDQVLVMADPDRLQQIVWNLLSNALKFTPAGGRVAVAVSPSTEGVELTVTDTGVGIPPEFLPCIFDRFAQADTSTTRSHGGLGLGLSIVSELVELHGGRVFAESEGEGSGARFHVRLPLPAFGTTTLPRTARPPIAGTEPSRGSLHGARILAIDDHEDTRVFVKTVIESAGAHAIVAGSVDEALALLPSAQPHVIVADIGMPGADGYEFLRRLHELVRESTDRVPVIALTAYGRQGDREQALGAGFAEHLSKPIGPEALLDAIARQLAGTADRLGETGG